MWLQHSGRQHPLGQRQPSHDIRVDAIVSGLLLRPRHLGIRRRPDLRQHLRRLVDPGVAGEGPITYKNGTSITYIHGPFWDDNSFGNNAFHNSKGSRALQIIHFVPPTAVWYDASAPGFHQVDVHATYEDIAASAFADEWSSHANVSGDLKGFHSIRVNDQWRVIFRRTVTGPTEVDVVDYH